MKTYLKIVILFIVLLVNPVYAYQSDKVTKVVISTNIVDGSENKPNQQERLPSNSESGTKNTVSKKITTIPIKNSNKAAKINDNKSGPLIKMLAIDFFYHNQQSIKPSIPGLRFFLSDFSSVGLSVSFKNITNKDNFFLFDSYYLLSIIHNPDIQMSLGLDFSYFTDPKDNYSLSLLFGIQKEVSSKIKFGVLYEPLAIKFLNQNYDPYVYVNNDFTTYLSWEL
ncbi:MAG: hypothetical protein DKM50_10600 [Candidatus Margulisiibacteriota bacterium]|nr:MAG: hypothetical protein A2X43_07005 [Candidatus Margulisbacteria bacterium GWD2_39_127]OGI02972.1 MAG: hypothetical protein A2X42_12830 [Candidatus Margulisbacteria bacterium GWF2_38_17]OGI09435.1 MAG: hypothetical protein A2X41_12415 [Candidatus Margulisbacteria bacterium GWE2_39_32]PZM78765.1 MAG: hypothetical protein DKM50_10600 [Candidatus Margulisiibacteriota bacterium]HAR63333.1 hypothetical protein [Candidatus Margulisiibacteriota bacterium]